jgi:hypothetical protein
MTEVTRRFIPQSLLSNDSKPNIYTYNFTPMRDQNIPTSLRSPFQRLSNHLIYQIRTLTTLTPFFTQEHCLTNVFEARIVVKAFINISRMCRTAVSSNNLPNSCFSGTNCASRKSADGRWAYVRFGSGTGLKKAETNPSLCVIHSSIGRRFGLILYPARFRCDTVAPSGTLRNI